MTDPIRILLIDGYAIVRNALRALITTAPGMEVVGEAAGRAEAVGQAILLKPDIVILDPFTIEGGGMKLIASLMTIQPQPHILVLTSEVNEQRVRTAIKGGIKGYLIKGTAAPGLLRAIRNLHKGEPAFDEAVVDFLL